MSIWTNQTLTLNDLHNFATQSISEYLQFEWIEIGPDFLKISMPVNEKVKQPYGLLHGGISCVLAETVGSIASALVIDTKKFYCVGIEINANHVRSAREGKVVATCSSLHLGRTSHVWDIKIHDEKAKLICVSRLTVAIVPILV